MFRSELATAVSSEQEESTIDDPDSEAVPGMRRCVDAHELVRFRKSAPGQRIAVPMRIEPKMYFTSEHTLLVCCSSSTLIRGINTFHSSFVEMTLIWRPLWLHLYRSPQLHSSRRHAQADYNYRKFFSLFALTAISYSPVILYREYKLRKRHTNICARCGAFDQYTI